LLADFRDMLSGSLVTIQTVRVPTYRPGSAGTLGGSWGPSLGGLCRRSWAVFARGVASHAV